MPPTGHPGHQPERAEHAEGPQRLDVQARAFAAHRGRVALNEVDLLQDHGEDPAATKEGDGARGQLGLCLGAGPLSRLGTCREAGRGRYGAPHRGLLW